MGAVADTDAPKSIRGLYRTYSTETKAGTSHDATVHRPPWCVCENGRTGVAAGVWDGEGTAVGGLLLQFPVHLLRSSRQSLTHAVRK